MPLLEPGTCWICEASPTQTEERVIDTRRNARAGGSLSHLSVRKYVCESCATDLGLALGMVTDKSHTDVLDQFHTLEEKVEDLQTERDELLRSLDALKQAFRSDAVV